ncbi:MAG TPA: protein translocase subunit SecF [Bacteroidota bacterium]|nr:protein translocase subunit SecF [Bacteroidota bacterium]
MRLFKQTNIDFMGKRNIWYVISLITLLIGIAGFFVRGMQFGIDFLGGTELLLRFEQPPAINEVRASMDKAGFTGSEIKSFGNPNDILIRVAEQSEGAKVAEKIRESLTTQFANNKFEVLSETKIGPKVGAELRRNALYAVGATLLIIMIYIGFRFEFIYGLAGVIALLHDVLLTVGIVVLLNGISPHLNLEITQTIMAAVLTLIGFSINDTVIVFDRIRENKNIHKTDSLFSIMNKSINETLSRTVITSGTVILVLIVLIIFGGEVNRGFAFTFFIGTISGTYSSIYVASAIVLDFNNWKAKQKAAKAGLKTAKAVKA